MEPGMIFKIANVYAVLCWLALVIRPTMARIELLRRFGVLGLALLYSAILIGTWGEAEGGFSTLAEVMKLFTYEWSALGGWVHYLAFDLFVGLSVQARFVERSASQFIRIPVLFFTFMVGPFGYLLFTIWNITLGRNKGSDSAKG